MMLLAAFAPLLHANVWTWDEMLMLLVGLALIMIMGYFGQRSTGEMSGKAVHLSTNSGKAQARPALTIHDVSQRYGQHWALARISLEIEAGQWVSILGPNGAGKSSLLHILATLTMPTAGDVMIGAASLQTNPTMIRRRVGLVAHQPLLYPELTVLENLSFFGQLYNLADWPVRAEQLLKQVHLWSKRHQLVRSLSQGQKQRVAIARALLPDPDILLLDEPYAGLDFGAAERLDELLAGLRDAGHTLLVTMHEPRRSYERSDQIVILAGGRLVYQAIPGEISLESLEATYQQVLAYVTEETDHEHLSFKN